MTEDDENMEENQTELQEPFSLWDAPFTFIIIFINVIVFLAVLVSKNQEAVFLQYGFDSVKVLQLDRFPTLVTSMFLHADAAHIFYNMILFLIFGISVERKAGHWKFLIIYFISGIFASLFNSLFTWGTDTVSVGASGAIFGVMTSFALLYPEMRGRGGGLRSFDAIIIYFLLETFLAFVDFSSHIAHFAHVGGGITGIIITALMFSNTRDLLKSIVAPEKGVHEDSGIMSD